MPKAKDSEELKVLMESIQDDKAFESLGIVVGEIAHDFNNILSLISGYVEMAMSEIPEGERARSDLEHVLAATDRATELVARIRTFSMNTKLKQSAISIDKAVNDSIAHLNTRLPSGIKLSSEIEESKGRTILGNETETFKIINNLCLNSIQAMPEDGGEIKISVNYFANEAGKLSTYPGLAEKDYVRIMVEDNGKGMSIDTVEQMYLPFFSTSREDGSGKKRAGLGLTTVHNIVTSQGGMIYVDSTVNKGTRFEVFLPLVHSEVQDTDNSKQSHAAGSTDKHVLVIDDEASIIQMATQILEKHGYAVTTFMDGNEAIEHFQQQPYHYDVVITDLIMPSMPGSEIASTISGINPNVPIILSTGFSDKIGKSTCASWGVDRVINKPFTINELLSSIESLT
jgi:CheY-like chemotaxis protein/nitrogen-specific signal transduction histidine kinase